MSEDEVLKRVEAIAAQEHASGVWDDETAHGMEDALWADVLRAIAAGDADAPALARAALTTQEMNFSRWTA